MLRLEDKARSGSTKNPFEEEIDHSKIPQFLSGKLAQLKINFENNMLGWTNIFEKLLQLTMNIIKWKEISFILNNLNFIKNNKSNNLT